MQFKNGVSKTKKQKGGKHGKLGEKKAAKSEKLEKRAGQCLRRKSEERVGRKWKFVSVGIRSRETGELNASKRNLGYN